MTDTLLNTSLLGRYRIDARLGVGGMGVVYRAHDELLRRDVAVKVISEAVLGSNGRVRLLAEAQAAAALNHPNIVTIYDVGETDSKPFIIMELLSGKTLREQRPQTFEELRSVARQICQALEHAHRHKIIHRDLKPENIMLVGSQIKLMDFGLARSSGDLNEDFLEGSVVGTPAYIAPEQFEGSPADERTDLYALGVVLYELAAGSPPFKADNLADLLAQSMYSTPALPSSLRPDLPIELEDLIMKLLARRPEDRCQSAAEVLEKLGAVYLTPVTPPALVRPRHNLPAQLSSFIGRKALQAEIRQAFDDKRLVSLVGSGGVGKTRLALQVGANLSCCFAGGIWLIELAPLSDPALLLQTVATTLGVREEPGRTLLASLVASLQERPALLILDNCEHLIEACAQLTENLLRLCPELHILATSREALGVPGEMPVRVPSLSLPAGREAPPLAELVDYEAVRLFVERAAAVMPGFYLTPENALHVLQICRRLDGIPLAIELAAARVPVLRVEQIAGRLDDRFRLLTGGSRTALPRQQTLRALIDWSYGLLSAPERSILHRLSVFSGGWTLEAAEAVCAECRGEADEVEVLDRLSQLVNKSLVVVDRSSGSEARYHLLETIRQYAREKLFESGQAQEARCLHFDYFLALAVEAEKGLKSASEMDWVQRLGDDQDNLRAALDWSVDQRPRGGVQLLFALRRYWLDWSPLGIQWLEALLQTPELSLPSRERSLCLVGLGYHNTHAGRPAALDMLREAVADLRSRNDESGLGFSLHVLGMCTGLLGDMDSGYRHLQASLALHRKLGLKIEAADNLAIMGGLFETRDYARARSSLEEALALYSQAGLRSNRVSCLNFLAIQALRHQEPARCRQYLNQAVEILQELHLSDGARTIYYALAELEMVEGNYDQAQAHLEELFEPVRRSGYTLQSLWILARLGYVALRRGEAERARAIFNDSLLRFQQGSIQIGVAYSLEGIASLDVAEGNLERAATLLTWCDTLRQALGDIRPPIEQVSVDQDLAAIAAALPAESLTAARTAAVSLGFEEVISLAQSTPTGG